MRSILVSTGLILALVLGAMPALAQKNSIDLARALLRECLTLYNTQQAMLARVSPSPPPQIVPILNRARQVLADVDARLNRLGVRGGIPPNLPEAKVAFVTAELRAMIGQLRALATLLRPLSQPRRDIAYVTRVQDRAERSLVSAQPAVTSLGSNKAQTLFSQAQDALRRSRFAFNKGDAAAARQLADRSYQLSQEILKLDAEQNTLEQKIERLAKDLDALQREAHGTSVQDAYRYFTAAATSVQASRDACRGGNPVLADTKYQLAVRSLNQARDALSKVKREIHSGARRYLDRAESFLERRLYPSAASNARLAERLAQRSMSLTEKAGTAGK
ncbi:MAG: hypothetical protein HY815_20755 [Candidatus Riflebacteria bacterium]|nr:hypothetical protein [Candidatus Riflebacteria bacterium]